MLPPSSIREKRLRALEPAPHVFLVLHSTGIDPPLRVVCVVCCCSAISAAAADRVHEGQWDTTNNASTNDPMMARF